MTGHKKHNTLTTISVGMRCQTEMLYPHLDAEQALMSITIEVEVEVEDVP